MWYNIIVDIINEGRQIPKEKLDQIFEKFYRLDSSRISKTGGSGLGLAIAKDIVQLQP
jgi:two-component system sensor histidine kinase VanS